MNKIYELAIGRLQHTLIAKPKDRIFLKGLKIYQKKYLEHTKIQK